jgi:hypothetical protein
MDRKSTKYWIIIIYWTAITSLLGVSFREETGLLENLLNCICFAVASIVVTLPFANKLFVRTLHKHKTVSFLIRFVCMSLFLTVIYTMLTELFFQQGVPGFLTCEHFISDEHTFLGQLLEGLPGTLSISFILCGILLYDEYWKLQKTLLESQLQSLHAQINPHFMFNVLNYIHVLMRKNTELASELLLKYSDTLRYQLYSGKKEFVKLEQEVVFLKNYIDVEKFRWEDKLDVFCNWYIENGNMEIPPLILIPFIENAFKHVSRSSEEKGFILTTLEQRKGMLSLKIENSKSNKPARKRKEGGIGLENVRKRLYIHYGERFSLTVKDMDTTYFTQLLIFI